MHSQGCIGCVRRQLDQTLCGRFFMTCQCEWGGILLSEGQLRIPLCAPGIASRILAES